MIAANDADDIAVRKALAERHLAAGERRRRREMGQRVPLYRRLRSDRARPARGRPGRRQEVPRSHRGVPDGLELKARKPNDLKVKLAKAQLGKGDRDAAKATLDGVLKADPEHPEAKALREEIESVKDK